MNKILLLVITLLLTQSGLAQSQYVYSEEEVRQFAYDSFQRVLVNSLEKNLAKKYEEQVANPSGLIIFLAEIDNDKARQLLLQLVEVYVGESTGEAVTYAILQQGKKIRPGLVDLLRLPVSCSLINKEEFKGKVSHLKCFTMDERNEFIREYIKDIDNGVKIEYVL